jgi:hypothetical protein
MTKKITYKGKEYEMEITWSGSAYCFKLKGFTQYIAFDMDVLDNIEKFKAMAIETIERLNTPQKHDLSTIQDWDGKL